MKINVIVVALMSCLVAGSSPKAFDTDTSKEEAPYQIDPALQRWRILDQKKRTFVEKNERNVAELRRALASDWNYVMVSSRYDCSCTGTFYRGFRLSRDGETYSVVPWAERPNGLPPKEMEQTVASRSLGLSEVDRLLSEAALFYLGATLSVTPSEKVGQDGPLNKSNYSAMTAKYLAAGGCPVASDFHWIDIRVATPDGLSQYTDMWDSPPPADYSTWITAFGTLSPR